MPERMRTAKQRAKRIQPDYFKRLLSMQRWLWLLSGAIVAPALGWLAWHAWAGSAAPYSAGPIRSAHASFASNCAACHATTALFFHKASNEACRSCHDGPIHQANQTFTPACAPCHREHTGAIDLTRTSDQWCTQCHANLQTRSGVLKVNASITSFTRRHHPEFAAVRNAGSDPGTIQFNHSAHLEKTLLVEDSSGVRRVQLECGDCHRPTAANASWSYGHQTGNPALPPAPKPHARQSERAYMAPVNYDEHCSGCHPLTYDDRFAALPHRKTPEQLDELIVSSYAAYIKQHPDALRDTSDHQKIARGTEPVVARDAAEWVQLQVSMAETLLWSETCKKCHALTYPAGARFPAVAKPNLTRLWLPKANFDHEAHQMVKCDSCHARARTSTRTSDVLIPGIAACASCHRPGDRTAAAGSCFECHVYHDWTKEQPVKGRYEIPQLSNMSRALFEPR